jgi:hypothetical protein
LVQINAKGAARWALLERQAAQDCAAQELYWKQTQERAAAQQPARHVKQQP